MKRSGSVHRRDFLTWAIRGVCAAPLALALGPALAAEVPHLEETDPTAAALGYKADASQVDASKYPQRKPGQGCSGCRYFQGKGDAWGPCVIFPGKAVSATGWCASFAAK